MNPNAQQFVVPIYNHNENSHKNDLGQYNNYNAEDETSYSNNDVHNDEQQYYGDNNYYNYNDDVNQLDIGGNYNYYYGPETNITNNTTTTTTNNNNNNNNNSNQAAVYNDDYHGGNHYNEAEVPYEGGEILAEEEGFYPCSREFDGSFHPNVEKDSNDNDIHYHGDESEEYFYSGGVGDGYYYELLPMGGVLSSNRNNYHHPRHHHDSVVPISAISMDHWGIYVGTNTVPLSRTTGSSLLNIYNFHSNRNDTLELHACTCAHPSLSLSSWQSIVQSSFLPHSVAIGSNASATSHHHPSTRRQRYNMHNNNRLMTMIPKHAYRPTFDDMQSSHHPANIGRGTGTTSASGAGQLGISQIIPLPSHHYSAQQSLNSNHHQRDDTIIASVSPWGIRLHSRGAQLHSSHPLEGALCCGSSTLTTSLYYDDTHAASGDHYLLNIAGKFGFSTYDIYTNQLLSTSSIRSSNPYSANTNTYTTAATNNNNNNYRATTTVIDMKPTIDHHTNNNAQKWVLACTDGTLRFWDVRTKYGEIAQVPSHDGGVVNIDTYQHHIATTGYSNNTSASSYNGPMNNTYNIPDPNVHTYDVRYLGRGGILHPFTGLAGGPRFVRYIPNQYNNNNNNTADDSTSLKLLVASGQVGGGIQIMDINQTNSYDATTQNDNSVYINPPLYVPPDINNNDLISDIHNDNAMIRGECITDLCTFQDRFAVGTSFGNVFHYRSNQPSSQSTYSSHNVSSPYTNNNNVNENNDFCNNINSIEEFPTLNASMIAPHEQQTYQSNHNMNHPGVSNTNEKRNRGITTIHANILLNSHITSQTTMPQSFPKIITALSTKTKINHNSTHPHELFVLSHLKNSSYTNKTDPYRNNTTYSENNTFGPLSQQIICHKGNKLLSKSLIEMIQEQRQKQQNSNKHQHHGKDDFLICLSVPTDDDRYKDKKLLYENYNQYLYSKSHASICYNINADPRSKPLKQYRNQHYSSSKELSMSSSALHHSSKPNYHSHRETAHESSSNFNNNNENSHSLIRNQNTNKHTSKSSKNDHERVNKKRTLWKRYICRFRPPNSIWTTLEYASYNNTGKWVGWDYGPSMPNSFVPPILALFYFIPEIRMAVKNQILQNKLKQQSKHNDSTDNTIQESDGLVLTSELGHLFHQIDCISAHAMTHQFSKNKKVPDDKAVMGCFVPRNFLSVFGTLPEASALALLDGAPAAVETSRRCEAFYRFFMHQFDKEMSYARSNNKNSSKPNKTHHVKKSKATTSTSKLMDKLQGIDFISMNEFVTGSGPPTISTTRAYTVDLSYEPFLPTHSSTTIATKKKENYYHFAEILQYSLCKDSRLRAWCEATKSFETVIQRKIATSLPTMLTLSCACAGTKTNDGLALWKQILNDDDNHSHQNQWLPELIEVEIEQSGNITVRQCVKDEMIRNSSSKLIWKSFKGKGLPTTASTILTESSNNSITTDNSRKVTNRRYRLESVVSYIKNNHNNVSETSTLNQQEGHHVVHVRVPQVYNRFAISQQIREIKNCLDKLFDDDCNTSTIDSNKYANNIDNDNDNDSSISLRTYAAKDPWTLTAHITKETYESRLKLLENKLEQQLEKKDDDDWIFLNGISVSAVDVNEACSFHNIDFREPCIVIYRDIESEQSTETSTGQIMNSLDWPKNDISYKVMNSVSLTNGSQPSHVVSGPLDLPKSGDLVALDAEFVQVGHEESELTANGSKIIVKEGRNALARMSLIDCRTGRVIIDDHILPKEPVIDYLTRFSGVEPRDLDPRSSSHHLITLQRSYLKIRYLVDRGCIFVGHGLSQDFFIINLFVPPSQIIDTLHIYHQKNRRYISLRFLANYLLGHDMQQDVHDSIEDANASFQLYLKAMEAKKEGRFEKLLMDIYELGDRTDWKIGIEERK